MKHLVYRLAALLLLVITGNKGWAGFGIIDQRRRKLAIEAPSPGKSASNKIILAQIFQRGANYSLPHHGLHCF
ncbi:MAG: hypothetical protein U0T74_00255 [Chitinophagales bacterium]